MAAYKRERGHTHHDSPLHGICSRKAAYKHSRGSSSIRSDISQKPYSAVETRIPRDGQLVLGAHPRGPDDNQASPVLVDSSVGARRTMPSYWHFVRNDMGKYPFMTAVNRILMDTAPFYAESTQKERKCKFRRIFKILHELKENGVVLLLVEDGQELRERISTANPKKMTERDVELFIAWCNKMLDASTAAKYFRFLEEVLLSVGNSSAKQVKLKRKDKIPKATPKPIRTISLDALETLVWGDWRLEDTYWDATARAAIALYSHTGLRSSELRYAKLRDLSLERLDIVVSHPKGYKRWASGEEVAPIMPGVEPILKDFLQVRANSLREVGLDPQKVDPLFPYISKRGKVGYWNHRMWSKLKCHIELVAGTRFRWKDMRPTFAQQAKDADSPIEAVSKALRHTDTRTTEQYYARIRSETAFSQLRQAWEAAAARKPKTHC